MLTLSIRQPWAWLIVHGYKDIENRSWKTKVRGEIAVHAGKAMTKADWNDAVHAILDSGNLDLLHLMSVNKYKIKAQRGGIVGVTTITDCVTESDSTWFYGDYGFVLEKAQPMQFLPLKGRLGFWENNLII